MRKGLTKDWSIDLDTDYASRVVDVSLQFIAPGRTIWIAVWGPPTDQSPEETLRGIKGELPNPNPDGKVEEWSDDRLEVRYANWYSEPGPDVDRIRAATQLREVHQHPPNST